MAASRTPASRRARDPSTGTGTDARRRGGAAKVCCGTDQESPGGGSSVVVPPQASRATALAVPRSAPRRRASGGLGVSGPNQAGLVGDDHQLGPVADVEL